MYKSILLLFSVLFLSFTTENNSVLEHNNLINDDIPILDFDGLEPLLYTDSDQIQIINFWAMWCAPCVKELPILQEYQINNPNVKITLVSLDFPEDIETKLKPFLKKKGLPQK
jgi:thiol-disulfide isomerase/thioredoxin